LEKQGYVQAEETDLEGEIIFEAKFKIHVELGSVDPTEKKEKVTAKTKREAEQKIIKKYETTTRRVMFHSVIEEGAMHAALGAAVPLLTVGTAFAVSKIAKAMKDRKKGKTKAAKTIKSKKMKEEVDLEGIVLDEGNKVPDQTDDTLRSLMATAKSLAMNPKNKGNKILAGRTKQLRDEMKKRGLKENDEGSEDTCSCGHVVGECKCPADCKCSCNTEVETTEETEMVTERKQNYQIYHNSYSSAVQHGREHAEKQGFEVSEDDWWHKVSTGPKKPSEGKTNSIRIPVSKAGKPTKKALSMQVFGMPSGKYELNMYIEHNDHENETVIREETKPKKKSLESSIREVMSKR
jgi:hypothetical protein